MTDYATYWLFLAYSEQCGFFNKIPILVLNLGNWRVAFKKNRPIYEKILSVFRLND